MGKWKWDHGESYYDGNDHGPKGNAKVAFWFFVIFIILIYLFS